jgi:hypothetical protein
MRSTIRATSIPSMWGRTRQVRMPSRLAAWPVRDLLHELTAEAQNRPRISTIRFFYSNSLETSVSNDYLECGRRWVHFVRGGEPG